MNASRKTQTAILLDGGDPLETQRIKQSLGYLDGQTTNPSLIAKNPEIKKRVAAGQKLTREQQLQEYEKIVKQISPLVGAAGVSIEVFADFDTPAEQMLAEGKKMFTWIPNAYIKYPCTHEGLRAAQMSVREGLRVNLTLCFSQQQAAAVYAATKGSKEPAYVSPFIGRLDDRGENGVDLIRNIKKMYEAGDGHVRVLAASLRKQVHLLAAFALKSELTTTPAHVLEDWIAADTPVPDSNFNYQGKDKDGKPLSPIPYQNLDLNEPWESFDIKHELTDKGIQKFVEDYRNTIA